MKRKKERENSHRDECMRWGLKGKNCTRQNGYCVVRVVDNYLSVLVKNTSVKTHIWFCQELWRDHTCANDKKRLIQNEKKSCKEEKNLAHSMVQLQSCSWSTYSLADQLPTRPLCLWLMCICVIVEGSSRMLSIKFNVAIYSSKLIISIELSFKKNCPLATRWSCESMSIVRHFGITFFLKNKNAFWLVTHHFPIK